MTTETDLDMPAHDPKRNRRIFLAQSVALAGFSMAASTHAMTTSADSTSVVPDHHELVRVKIEIDVKGNVRVPENALVSKETHQTYPIRSHATLDYEEQALRPADADPKSEIVAAERYYHTASSTSDLNKSSITQELRPSMRRAIVRRESLPETIYSADNFYTHGELSLLKSPVSSVSVDLFLPRESVIKEDRYEIPADALCSVLNLTSVDSGKVEGTVVEVVEDAVRFKLEGDLQASVDGVSTRLRLRGKVTFDRKLKTSTWFALAIHETREISRAEPGFDVSATIRMVRRPMSDPVALLGEPAKIDFEGPIPAERMYVELQSRQLKVGTMMDRRWRMIGDSPRTAVMRMIENDSSIAQCNLRSLVRLPEGKQWTLDAFESDVRTTLGEQLRQLVEGDQRVSAQGLRVLRLVADGETQGVPIRWIMMHFSDDSGRRVQATFTMSGDKVGLFAGNDAQFADSLRFLEPSDIHDGKPSETESMVGEFQDGLEIASGDVRHRADDSNRSAATSSSDLR
jgi:hypothetical protein